MHKINDDVSERIFDAAQKAAVQIREAIKEATPGLVNREQLAELIILGAVAQENLLVHRILFLVSLVLPHLMIST